MTTIPAWFLHNSLSSSVWIIENLRIQVIAVSCVIVLKGVILEKRIIKYEYLYTS